jgi:hypothetical protein
LPSDDLELVIGLALLPLIFVSHGGSLLQKGLATRTLSEFGREPLLPFSQVSTKGGASSTRAVNLVHKFSRVGIVGDCRGDGPCKEHSLNWQCSSEWTICSSSAWLSPIDSAHIKWVVKALNSIWSEHGRDEGTFQDDDSHGVHGKAEEIAAAAVFLPSEESSFITGIDLPVDGGLVAV